MTASADISTDTDRRITEPELRHLLIDLDRELRSVALRLSRIVDELDSDSTQLPPIQQILSHLSFEISERITLSEGIATTP